MVLYALVLPLNLEALPVSLFLVDGLSFFDRGPYLTDPFKLVRVQVLLLFLLQLKTLEEGHSFLVRLAHLLEDPFLLVQKRLLHLVHHFFYVLRMLFLRLLQGVILLFTCPVELVDDISQHALPILESLVGQSVLALDTEQLL